MENSTTENWAGLNEEPARHLLSP